MLSRVSGRYDETMAIVIGIVLLLVLAGFALLMNPPNAWVDKVSGDKKDKRNV